MVSAAADPARPTAMNRAPGAHRNARAAARARAGPITQSTRAARTARPRPRTPRPRSAITVTAPARQQPYTAARRSALGGTRRATRSPGTTEIIEHGANGLLVEHDAHAVAQAIALLLNDRSLRERVTARARLDVRQYDVPEVAGRYERLLQEVTV